jgi:hypothetical protein
LRVFTELAAMKQRVRTIIRARLLFRAVRTHSP